MLCEHTHAHTYCTDYFVLTTVLTMCSGLLCVISPTIRLIVYYYKCRLVGTGSERSSTSTLLYCTFCNNPHHFVEISPTPAPTDDNAINILGYRINERDKMTRVYGVLVEGLLAERNSQYSIWEMIQLTEYKYFV